MALDHSYSRLRRFPMQLVKIVEILEEIGRLNLLMIWWRQDRANSRLENNVERIAVALDANPYILKKSRRHESRSADHSSHSHLPSCNQNFEIPGSFSQTCAWNEISLNSMHTNYDRVKGGINDALATRIGLKNIETVEIGRIGEIDPCSSDELASHVSNCLRLLSCMPGKEKESGGYGHWRQRF